MNIVHVTPRPDFMLLIESDEGSSGIFDVRPYLALEAFCPLQDAEAFAKVQNGRAARIFLRTRYLLNGSAARQMMFTPVLHRILRITPRKADDFRRVGLSPQRLIRL